MAFGIFRPLGVLLAHYLTRPRPLAQMGMPTEHPLLAQSLRPGDVLLVNGSSRVSGAIKYLTQSTWSHAAFFVGPQLGGADSQGQPYQLIEADMLQGVCKRPLSHYHGYQTRICRPSSLTPSHLERLLQDITSKLGEQYDLKNVWDLGRYLLPAPPVPTRWRRQMIALGSGDPTRAICSSLTAEAFQSVGYPVLPAITQDCRLDPVHHQAVLQEIFHIRDRSLYAPRDFDVSPYFDIVKPTLATPFDYQSIQWA